MPVHVVIHTKRVMYTIYLSLQMYVSQYCQSLYTLILDIHIHTYVHPIFVHILYTLLIHIGMRDGAARVFELFSREMGIPAELYTTDSLVDLIFPPTLCNRTIDMQLNMESKTTGFSMSI